MNPKATKLSVYPSLHSSVNRADGQPPKGRTWYSGRSYSLVHENREVCLRISDSSSDVQNKADSRPLGLRLVKASTESTKSAGLVWSDIVSPGHFLVIFFFLCRTLTWVRALEKRLSKRQRP